jgi:methyl-accepting chemotaxis protein
MQNKLITMLLLVSLVPLITISLLLLEQSKDTLMKEIALKYAGIAEDRASIVRSVIETRMKQAETLAASISDYITANEYSRISGNAMQLFNELQNVGARPKVMYVTDGQGNILFSTDKGREGKSIADYDIFKRAKNNSFGEINKDDQGLVLQIGSPIIHEGKTIGTVLFETRGGVFMKALLNRDNLGESGETYLVNGSKLMVTPSRFIEGAEFKQVVDTLPVRECFESGKNIKGMVYPDYRGVPIYGASYCMSDLNLVLLAEIDESEALMPVHDMQNKLLLLTTGIGGGVAALAFFMGRSTARPLIEMSKEIKNLGHGDLTVRISNTNRKDEIGELATTLNRSIESFKEVIANTNKSSESVVKSINDISVSVEQINSSTQQITIGIQQVSKGSQDQAARINEISSTMQSITTGIKETSSKMIKTVEFSNDINKLASSGINDAELTITSMENMINVSDNAATMMNTLVEKSAKISNVLEIIQKIAEQTNMLALNAAIEAARAGEAGRGFAVVAEEVRALAINSAKASDEIAKIIQDLQNDAKHTAEIINASASGVKESKYVIENTINNFKGMITKTNDMINLLNVANESLQVQMNNIDDINRSIAEIAAVSEENAAAVEEITAAIEEQSASLHIISEKVQTLVKLSEDLKHAISKFNIDARSKVDLQIDAKSIDEDREIKITPVIGTNNNGNGMNR